MKSNKITKNKFGINLYTEIERKGFTIERLAEILNVEPRSIYYWLSNQRHPNYDVLLEISDIFGKKVDDLLR